MEQPKTAKIYVGNLPFVVSDEEILKLVAKAVSGALTAKVQRDAQDRPRGFAYVRVRAPDDEVRQAITRLNGSGFKGRKLIVDDATDEASNVDCLEEA